MHFLSFDQDWAPDWALDDILNRLEEAGLGGTVFITHDSPLLERMKTKANIELGWHPNFLPGSSHGESVEEVLNFMASLVPGAVGARAHTLMRGTPILEAYKTRGLRYDAADIFDGQQGLSCFLSWTGLTRIPIYFEDDVHLHRGLPLSLKPLHMTSPGLKVFTFHPVLVALNCSRLSDYQALKADLGTRGVPLTEASRQDFRAHIQREEAGMGDLFQSVVTWLSERPDAGRRTLASLVGG